MDAILKDIEAAIKADVQPLLKQKADLATAAAKAQKARHKADTAQRQAAERHADLNRTIGTIEGREAREQAKERLHRAADELAAAVVATGVAKSEYSKLAAERNALTAQITRRLAELLQAGRESFDNDMLEVVRAGVALHTALVKIGSNIAAGNGEGSQEIERVLAPMGEKLEFYKSRFRVKDF